MNQFECGYWIDDGTEDGFCRYDGSMCSYWASGHCPLIPNEELDDEEFWGRISSEKDNTCEKSLERLAEE